jgi:hypothetical protein
MDVGQTEHVRCEQRSYLKVRTALYRSAFVVLAAVHAYLLPGPSVPYSPECVEGLFSEVRPFGGCAYVALVPCFPIRGSFRCGQRRR